MRYYLLNVYLARVLLALAGDLACAAVAAAVTWITLSPAVDPTAYVLGTGVGAGLVTVALYYADAYGLLTLGSGRRTLQAALVTMGLVAGLAGLTYLFVRLPAPTFELAARSAALYFPLLLAWRLAFRLLQALPRFRERIVVVGTSPLARSIVRAVAARRNLGTEVVGYLSDDPDEQGTYLDGVPVLAPVHRIEKVLRDERVDRVVVASKRRDEHFPEEALLAAKFAGLRIESGVRFYERATGRIYLRDLRGSYLIFSDGFCTGRCGRVAKRVLDVAGAGLGLVLLSPLLALAAAAIRLEDGGPVFYRQTRIGEGGRLFDVIKLRTMRTDAEARSGAAFAGRRDDRITRVGRVLRPTRIDELPQLWNVLRGEMSLVGPRPERPEFAEELASRYPYFRYRCAAKPGITGWAQIRFGYVNSIDQWEEKLALDLYYLKYRSVLMDLLILWNTLKTVVRMEGV